MPFATPDDLDTFTGQDVDAARATLMLDLASAAVSAAAGIPIEAATADETTLDGNGATVLLLPAWPVTDVTAVTVDGDAITNYTWTRTGELRRDAGWPRGSVVAVTYDHGYATIPDGIKMATLMVASRLLGSPSGVRSESIGDYSVTYQDPSGVSLVAIETSLIARSLT